MTPRRPRAMVASVALAASACVYANPDFDPTSASGGEATTSASVSVGSMTNVTSTAGSTGSTSTTEAVETTVAETSDTSRSTIGDASSGGPTVDPGTYKITATVAACVLLDNGNGYGPPSVCGAVADALNGTALTGLMLIDTRVSMGNGADRRAESFLRFDVPAEYGSLVVAEATLHVEVADGGDMNAGGPWRGTLVTTSAFDERDLGSGAPGVDATLADDLGAVAANESVVWPIPANLVEPGAPLFLGLLPTDTDGVLYRGRNAPGAPYLEVVLVAP